MTTDAEPDRVFGLYMTLFRKGKESSQCEDADSVLISCNGSYISLKLPRDAETFESVKKCLRTAYEIGRDSMRYDLKSLLEIKDCDHDD